MDKEVIEALVEKKIAEAKLQVAEKRLHYVLWLAGAALALFGAIIPLWLSNQASDRVDKAVERMKTDVKGASDDFRSDSRTASDSHGKVIDSIRTDIRGERDFQSKQMAAMTTKVDTSIEKMERQFKELAGSQLRMPKFESLWRGTPIEGKRVTVERDLVRVQLKNTGDGTAHNVSINIYGPNGLCSPDQMNQSDEPGFPCILSQGHIPYLQPQQLVDVEGYIFIETKSGEYPALLKIMHDHGPTRFPFVIVKEAK